MECRHSTSGNDVEDENKEAAASPDLAGAGSGDFLPTACISPQAALKTSDGAVGNESDHSSTFATTAEEETLTHPMQSPAMASTMPRKRL